MPPQYPLSKNITSSFFVCGSNFVGIAGEIGNMATGNIVWGMNFHGNTGKFGRVSAQCEAVWSGDGQGVPERSETRLLPDKFWETECGAIARKIGNRNP